MTIGQELFLGQPYPFGQFYGTSTRRVSYKVED